MVEFYSQSFHFFFNFLKTPAGFAGTSSAKTKFMEQSDYGVPATLAFVTPRPFRPQLTRKQNQKLNP